MGMLPSPRTELIGRDDELAAVCDLVVERLPVITIVGVGGTGKTRLATALSRRAVDTFSGQVWFVPLAGIIEAAVVPAAIAGALQVRASADRSLEVAVCDTDRHCSSSTTLSRSLMQRLSSDSSFSNARC